MKKTLFVVTALVCSSLTSLNAADADPPTDVKPVSTQTLGPATTSVDEPVQGKTDDGPRSAPRSGAPGADRQGGPASARLFDAQVLSDDSRLPEAAQRQALAAVALAPVVGTSFVGMSQVTPTSPGWGYPPDTSLAAGGTHVVQVVNRRVRMTNPTGGSGSTLTLDAFFKGTSTSTMFDPKVFYDRNATNRRFYVIALDGSSTAVSRLHLAVSRSADPTALASTQWCRYSFDARVPVAGRAATWADYPSIGTGPNGLLITTNQFSDAGAFQYNAIWAFNKLLVNSNAAGCPTIRRYNWAASSALGDSSAFTVQPVQHYTNPSSFTGISFPNYLVNSYSGTGSLYRVWRVYNLASGSPLLQVANLFGSYTYATPPQSPGGRNPATGAATKIDSGDTRTLQAAGIGNRLYATHSTSCQFTAGTALEACARYVAIDVGATTSGGIAAAIRQQTTNGGGDGYFYHHPSVAVNNAGAVASAFNVNSVSGVSSSAYATKSYTESNFPAEYYLAQGNCFASATYQAKRGANRSGDYNGAQTSPDGTTFWLAAERSVAITGVGCGWQTQVARVTP